MSLEQYPSSGKKGGELNTFKLVIFIILILVFFGYFVKYAMTIIDTVDEVNIDKSRSEMQQSLIAIRSKWLTHKQSVVTLSLLKDPSIKKQGVASFRVNQYGWPINVYTSLEEKQHLQVNCKNLWLKLQSQPWLTSFSVKMIKNSVDGSIKGCEFNLHKKKKLTILQYFFTTGQVVVNV